MLAETYNWFTEGFDTADLKDAKLLLDELGGYSLLYPTVPGLCGSGGSGSSEPILQLGKNRRGRVPRNRSG